MFKPGVWKRGTFLAAPPSGALARLFHRLSHSRVSLHLLAIPDEPSAEDIGLFEKLMPHVRLSSGVYRTTYRQRFRGLNPAVNNVLRRSFSASQPLRVEDWAASDCLTSAEWAVELFPLFPHLEFVASDLLLFLLEAKKKTGQERFILEPDGTPLQYIRPPFVVRLSQPESKLFLFNWLLAGRARRAWERVRPSVKLASSPSLSPGTAEQVANGFEIRKLPVAHPEALRLAKEDSRFSIRSHSAFEGSDEPCNVIRTMNIYNRAYFSEDRLREGVRAVLGSLKPDGIWIVGRTADEAATSHNVTMFRKRDSGLLDVIERVGEGSEIEDLSIRASQSFAERIVAR
jgi:hypothetical protein